MNFLFISCNNIGNGLSGGDRIWLELARHWSRAHKINIIGSQETSNLLSRYNLNLPIKIADSVYPHLLPTTINIIRLQIRRTILVIKTIISNLKQYRQYDYFYTSSDFYPDLLSGLILKLAYPQKKWIAGYYLFAPNPLDQQSPYNRLNQAVKGWVYYLGQIPGYYLVRLYADIVFITSNPDSIRFPGKKCVVVQGGVDTRPSIKWLKKHSLKPPSKRKFLGCFIGRLHPQKGIVELIDIWHQLIKAIPNAKLAIIGDGELKTQVNRKIKKYKLQKNIRLLGFLDGPKKEAIFRNSAIILHPATYDSGGMAAAEAMAWGLPGVSYDLPALRSYYPNGVIKVPQNRADLFIKAIQKLTKDPKFYQQTSIKAKQLINTYWSWQQRSSKILAQII